MVSQRSDERHVRVGPCGLSAPGGELSHQRVDGRAGVSKAAEPLGEGPKRVAHAAYDRGAPLTLVDDAVAAPRHKRYGIKYLN